VPEFSLSPDPGGHWNWLLGLLALALASSTLVLLARHAVARRPAESPQLDKSNESDESDDEQHWQDRLDDELIDAIE
jgi:hypothetical protein